jgi:predicted HTH transcriptional regulator
MNPGETQIIEWKESWRDEYLRWICGFANAQNGKLIIGKNDKGAVVGAANARKLLEDIPNKIRDILGIIVDVNLRVEQGKELLEIVVEPYPYPISYEGISRVEKFPFPKAARREALLNAIVHKDYSGGSPIQISVYENQIYFWNDG